MKTYTSSMAKPLRNVGKVTARAAATQNKAIRYRVSKALLRRNFASLKTFAVARKLSGYFALPATGELTKFESQLRNGPTYQHFQPTDPGRRSAGLPGPRLRQGQHRRNRPSRRHFRRQHLQPLRY